MEEMAIRAISVNKQRKKLTQSILRVIKQNITFKTKFFTP